MEWTKYTTKETLKDNDELMILDKDANANKRTLMDKIWNYVVDKMTTAVIAKLETTNKTLIGAVNELNSKSFFTVDSGGCIYTVKLRTFTNILFIATVRSLYVYSNGYLTTAIEDGKFSKCEISKDYLTVTITSVCDKERFSLGIIGMKDFEVKRIK